MPYSDILFDQITIKIQLYKNHYMSGKKVLGISHINLLITKFLAYFVTILCNRVKCSSFR